MLVSNMCGSFEQLRCFKGEEVSLQAGRLRERIRAWQKRVRRSIAKMIQQFG